MKNSQKLFISCILMLMSSTFCIAQTAAGGQAGIADYVATWTGTGDDGNTYSLVLNTDYTASLTQGTTALDVTRWKLNYKSDGSGIDYDSKDRGAMLLITALMPTSANSTSTQTLTAGAGKSSSCQFKAYLAESYYDVPANTLTLTLDFRNPDAGAAGLSAVKIQFTK